jgi:hypothetical protein
MARFPSRQAGALGGNEFLATITQQDDSSRDNIFVQEILRGNIPSFLKQMVPIKVEDKGNTLIYRVTPDYLCLGDDNDYVRVPLGAPAAQRIADAFGCTLPTAKMSNQIWKEAKAQLEPKPMSGRTSTISGKTYSPSQFLAKKMTDTDSFAEHNKLIQEQLSGHQPGDLVAGHKKDVVLSNQLSTRPDRVAIHGLHNTKGQAIQGGSWGHEITYRDYSHGIRLVDRAATLNGKPVDLVEDVMKDPTFAYLVSDEGALQFTSYKYKKEDAAAGAPKEDAAIAQKFKDIDKYLEQLSSAANKIASRKLILQRVLDKSVKRF